MNDLPFVVESGGARATLDLRVYRLTAVKKAAYRLAGRCTVVLGAPDGDSLPVSVLFKPGTLDAVALDTVRAFFEELLDQELREEIAGETGPVRALILAHAFSKTDLIRRQ